MRPEYLNNILNYIKDTKDIPADIKFQAEMLEETNLSPYLEEINFNHESDSIPESLGIQKDDIVEMSKFLNSPKFQLPNTITEQMEVILTSNLKSSLKVYIIFTLESFIKWQDKSIEEKLKQFLLKGSIDDVL